MPPTKLEAAKMLAEAHSDLEPGIVQVFVIREAEEQERLSTTPIKLLEVNVDTCASGIIPLQFGPNPSFNIPYPSVIVQITPAEFDLLRQSKLSLPKDWVLGEQLYGASA